jgi:virulence-associated protein VagC
MIEPRFGWRWSVPLLDISLDTELFVGLSTRRGVPLRLEGELLSSRVQSDFSLFLLDDRASDRNPLSRTVARDGDTRGRVRWDTLTHFDRGWSLETTLALASDPLVDPEFFHREWVTEDDARSEVYVKRVGSAVILYPKDDPWALLRESLDEFADDFLPDGRPDQGEHEQREPL